MYTAREYDIMLLEAQEENDKLLEEVALELLGNRAARMINSGKENIRLQAPSPGQGTGQAAPAIVDGQPGSPAGAGPAGY